MRYKYTVLDVCSDCIRKGLPVDVDSTSIYTIHPTVSHIPLEALAEMAAESYHYSLFVNTLSQSEWEDKVFVIFAEDMEEMGRVEVGRRVVPEFDGVLFRKQLGRCNELEQEKKIAALEKKLEER